MHKNARTPWNQGRSVGPRTKFDPVDVCAVVQMLQNQRQYHDLCLFTAGIDSMLRCSDLLRLKVSDITNRYGVVQERFTVRQKKTSNGVAPTLTKAASDACQKWIEHSGKKPDHFLFTRTKPIDGTAIKESAYRTLVKHWASLLRLDPTNYSTHSLRRSKPHFLFRAGVEIEFISELLGHKDTSTTYRYLGITQEEAQAFALKHDIFKKSQHRKSGVARTKSKSPDIFETCLNDLSDQMQSLQGDVKSLEEKLVNLLAASDLQSDCLKQLLNQIQKLNHKKD